MLPDQRGMRTWDDGPERTAGLKVEGIARAACSGDLGNPLDVCQLEERLNRQGIAHS